MTLTHAAREFAARLRGERARIYNLAGSSEALFLAFQEKPFIAIEADDALAERLAADVLFFRRLLGISGGAVCYLPPANGGDHAGERADTVRRVFADTPSGSICTTRAAYEAPVWPPGDISRFSFTMSLGDEAEREGIEHRLLSLGYAKAPLVTEPGDYSLRGFILDVYPSAGDSPVRVEFFGDEIESIRLFDVDTQRSLREVESIVLLPAREPESAEPLSSLASGHEVFLAEDTGAEAHGGACVFSRFPIGGEGTDAGVISMSGRGLLLEERKDVSSLPKAVERAAALAGRVVLVSPSSGQADRLREIFGDEDVACPLLDIGEVSAYEGRVSISVGGLSAGLFIPGLLILTEHEMFGERPEVRPLRKSRVAHLVTSVEDLRDGDLVVHEDRGIGRFRGLLHTRVEDEEYDLMVLEYLGGDKIYLPLYSIEKVRKYHGGEGVEPRLDRLGSAAWLKTKARIGERVREMAERLLRLYAEREVADGFAFSSDTELHREFDSFFLYDETPDQVRAIEEIKRDMENPRPMDRLLSGDVGYGKTEVAMRAAFKAVFDGKQVAVLVPTTLLCEQHLRVFGLRFQAFPARIESLNRFKPPKERARVLKAAEAGEVDILIATHSLLRANLRFNNLGLLIIDEEHRFGVRQKDHIKELKSGVDVLAMSATPIPRTLQMSLSGIRKMSVIETPPEERMAVATEVSIYDEGLIRRAIERELARGGQVFFVHNRIQDMEKVARSLEKLVPLARIATAHGRMQERELERIMLKFLNREADVLLSTAIIGSGLDIPSANTIIIDRADAMGLADLYQLRGRVGRGPVKAYAYCLVPPGGEMTDEAHKRLQAVAEHSYMGAGFRLAMRDLEIRGAGNLLGAEQSGAIEAVGFDLYMEMLERAVSEARGESPRRRILPTVSVKAQAFIPESYIDDMTIRLSVYREIAEADSVERLGEREAELTDRFGMPPAPLANLIRIMQARLMAARLQIAEVAQAGDVLRVAFLPDADMDADMLLRALGGGMRFLKDGFEVRAKGEPLGAVLSVLQRLEAGTVFD